MSNEIVRMIITLLGALAVFIFGMNYMSDGLQKAAGEKMKNILSVLTSNPIIGVLAGALVTAVIQSSSATIVMVIGFVTAGILELPQAISVIMGANIGTTVTAQLIAFNIGDYAWLFVIIGFIMFFFMKKKERVSNIGQIIFGFGILFVGMNTMASTMKPLATSDYFINMMVHVQNIPALGVLIGLIMTMIVQSSSATIAVLQNLASTAGPDGITSIIGLKGSIPVLFGDNIGTTITALLASIGANISAKRTAVSHVIFNISGTLIFVWFVPQIAKLVTFISPHGAELHVISRQIANTHLLFNVANTIIWLPLIWLMVKIVTKIVPGEDKQGVTSAPQYLDSNALGQSVFAIQLAQRELARLISFTQEMIIKAKNAFLSDDMDAQKEVLEIEQNVNELQDKTVNYLASILSSETITDHQKEKVSGLLHIASDIEHIGDHCKNIVELAHDKVKNHYDFSDRAYAEIYECFEQGTRILKETRAAIESGSEDVARNVLKQEEEINKTEERLRRAHMQRLYDNTCSPAFTVTYTDTIHQIEKVGDCCNNIAEAILDDIHFNDESIVEPQEV